MRSILVGCLVLLLLPPCPAPAWGPHTEITAAALAVLPERDRLRRYLGADFDRLARDYCWMADWKEAVRPDHYADDYLLFPGMTTHLSHMLPEVRRTFAPYFRRALQAIRTESPHNAARWVGSLLHFVQDSGSPPHTTGIGGELHSKMERWVDESQITLAGYVPRLLGKTADEALRGLEERMERLIDFSKARAIKLRPLVEKLTKRVNQPLELECALEVARVSADVVHTLFTLGRAEPARPGCVLHGKLNYAPPSGYAPVPARVMLAGTSYSTTTDPEGRYRFRNLPPGRYTVLFLATGYEVEQVKDVVLTTERETELSPRLRPDAVAGNLVRNARFECRWLQADRPDWWTKDPRNPRRWASAVIRVPVGQKCAVRVEFQPGKQVPVLVRWRGNPSALSESREAALDPKRVDEPGRLSAEVAPDERIRPFEKGVLFLEVLLQTERDPAEVCRHVALGYRPAPPP
ncbi:MAG: carboxypeptidase regulatory-like domain-containing protein [Gemmataceae bacterium]|nr:carboxypeptidase regulatory-like domain-containing protein [Gemmataceae bacterium]